MLLYYHDNIVQELSKAGILETLQREEHSCSFADELHGVRHAFNREVWGDYV
jgi:hypothetical protein